MGFGTREAWMWTRVQAPGSPGQITFIPELLFSYLKPYLKQPCEDLAYHTENAEHCAYHTVGTYHGHLCCYLCTSSQLASL